MRRAKRLTIRAIDPGRGVMTLSDGTSWQADFDDLAEVTAWLPGQAVSFRGTGPLNQLLNRSTGSAADVTICGPGGVDSEQPVVGP